MKTTIKDQVCEIVVLSTALILMLSGFITFICLNWN